MNTQSPSMNRQMSNLNLYKSHLEDVERERPDLSAGAHREMALARCADVRKVKVGVTAPRETWGQRLISKLGLAGELGSGDAERTASSRDRVAFGRKKSVMVRKNEDWSVLLGDDGSQDSLDEIEEIERGLSRGLSVGIL